MVLTRMENKDKETKKENEEVRKSEYKIKKRT